MKTIKNNLKLSKIKGYAIRLRSNYQLPYYLCYLIRNLDSTSSDSYIESLKRDSEHFLRIKGYYKRYPMIEEETNTLLKEKYNGLERK